MKWRKLLAWCLSWALLLGAVSVIGSLPTAAADEPGATVVPLTAGNVFTADNGITNLMTTRAQLGVSGGKLQTSCDKYFDGIVPGVTTADANWGDWTGLAADTDYYLWYDFGTATPLNAIELGGINGNAGFPTYTLPGFSLYATDDLAALQAGTLTPLATVSATETAKNKGFVAVLDSTVSVRYVGVKLRSYSHVGKSQECWISELGAACVTDDQKKELVANGNAYVKYVSGALAYALTEAPAQTSLICGQSPVGGANTVYGKTEVGGGSIAALTDGLYPGINQKITVARNADGSIQSNQWGVITTAQDTLGTFSGISTASNYCDVTYDMGATGQVSSFLIGSSAESSGVQLSEVQDKSEAEIQALMAKRMTNYVRLHTGAFFVSDDLATLYNEENRAATWDYTMDKAVGTNAAVTPLAAQYVLDEAKTGRYVGFRLYDCSYGNTVGSGWYSQIRVGELGVFGSLPNHAARTAVTDKSQLPTGRSLLAGKLPYNTDGTALRSSNGQSMTLLTDGRYQGLDDIVTYVTGSDPGTDEKPNDPVPGQDNTYFAFWSWGYAKTTAEESRVTISTDAASYRLYFDLGDSTAITDFAVGSSVDRKSFARGNGPKTEEAYAALCSGDANLDVDSYLYTVKIWVSDELDNLYSDDALCVDWTAGTKAEGQRNLFSMQNEVQGRYVGFEFPAFNKNVRLSELAVYGEDSLTVTELNTANAELLPRNNLLAGVQALTGSFAPIQNADIGREVNGVIGGVTHSGAEEGRLATTEKKLSYVLPSTRSIDRILVAGSIGDEASFGDGVDNQHIKAYKVYISDSQNTLWSDASCVLNYANPVTVSGEGICQLIQLKTPVSGRYVGFELSAGAYEQVRVSELGVYAAQPATTAIKEYDYRKLPTDKNLLTGLAPKGATASVGFIASYEGTDDLLCRVNVPQSFTNQMGVSGMSASTPADFYYDLGAAVSIDRLLFGNNGSDGGTTYMEPYYQIFAGDDPETLFSGTPLVDNTDAKSAQAFLHTLAQPVTARYVGYRIGGVSGSGRIADLGVYAADQAALASYGTLAEPGTDLLAGLTAAVSGTEHTYTLPEVKLPDAFTVNAPVSGSIYVSSLRNGLFAPENRVADFAAGGDSVTLDEAATGRYIGIRLESAGEATVAAYETRVSVTQLNAPADAAKLPTETGLLNGVSPSKYNASKGTPTATGTGAAYATDGKIGGVNADTVLTEKLAVEADGAGLSDLVYRLDRRYRFRQFLVAASNEGQLQGSAHYEIYVSDHAATLFRQQNRVITYQNIGEYNLGQLLTLRTEVEGRYVGLRILAGSYNQVRLAEFNAFGDARTEVTNIYTFSDEGLLPTATNLITGKVPVNADANVSGAEYATDNIIYGIQNRRWRSSGNQMTAYTTAPAAALTYQLDAPTLVEEFLVASYSNCSAEYEMIREYQIFVSNDPEDLYTAAHRVASYTATDYAMAQRLRLDQPALGTYVGFLIKANDGVFTAFGGTHFVGIGDLGVYGTAAGGSGTPVAIEGAQIRAKTAAGTGLRFATSVLAQGDHAACMAGDTVQIDGEERTIERVGTLVIRQSKLTGELAFDSEGSIPEKAKDVPAEKLYVRGDGYVTFIVTVTNIPDTRLDDVLTARSYIRLEDGTVLYGNALSRSVDGVRAAAARGDELEVPYEPNTSTFSLDAGETVSLGRYGEFTEFQYTSSYELYNYVTGETETRKLTAQIAVPDTVAEGDHWVYQAEFYGHRDAALATARQFVRDGWYTVTLGGIGDTYGCDDTLRVMNEFQQKLVQHFGLNEKCVMMGVSRGGLYSARYALAYPQNVAGLYLDAPVQDIRSWPGSRELREAGLVTSSEFRGSGGGRDQYTIKGMSEWEGCKKAFGLTSDAEAIADRTASPIWHYDELMQSGIPVLLQISRTDTCVPYEENGLKMYQAFRDGGAKALLLEETEADLLNTDITAYKGYQLLMIEATDIPTSRDGRGGHIHGWYTPALTSAYIRENMSGN